MKKLIIVCLSGVLSLCALAQNSELNSDTNTVTVSPTKSDFRGQAHYPMRPDEFFKFQRNYELSNGGNISLYSRGPIMYAKVNNGPAERLIATSANTFFSSKSILKLKINLLDNDEVSGEAYLSPGNQKANPIANRG